jgi:hypothetical protein
MLLCTTILLVPSLAGAQEHKHTPGMVHPTGAAATTLPTLAGQDAYAAVGEVVRILEADSATDWSRVNLEALRQHLIDMNEVTLHSAVRQTPIDGGLVIEVTGEGRALESIRRMMAAHTPMLDGLPDYVATSAVIPNGARLTIQAEQPGDRTKIAKIRGLGFIGLLTVGDHHAPHHLALARGAAKAHSH